MNSTIQGCHRGHSLKSFKDGFNLAIVRLDGRNARLKRMTGSHPASATVLGSISVLLLRPHQLAIASTSYNRRCPTRCISNAPRSSI